jgi:hypothetical protein
MNRFFFHVVHFWGTIFFIMWPFEQPAAVAVIDPAPPVTLADQLAECEVNFQRAERDFNKAHQQLFNYARRHPDPRFTFLNHKLFCRWNALTADPQRQTLEAAMSAAKQKRDTLLQERAGLMQALGQVR